MSSFIVDDKTINRILTWIYWIPSDSRISKAYIYSEAEKLGFNLDLDEPDSFQKLGQALLQLNYDAVNYRYDWGKGKAKDFYYVDDKTKDTQVLMSLNCLKYQCKEGDIDKTELYKFLELLELSIMTKIIHEKTDYDKCEWG